MNDSGAPYYDIHHSPFDPATGKLVRHFKGDSPPPPPPPSPPVRQGGAQAQQVSRAEKKRAGKKTGYKKSLLSSGTNSADTGYTKKSILGGQ